MNESRAIRLDALNVSHEQMGDFWSDVTNYLNPITATQQMFNDIGWVVNTVGQQLSQIDWQFVGESIGNAARQVANILIQIDPEHWSYQLFSDSNFFGIETAHTFNEFNQVTGGLMTSVDNVWTLPLRVSRGDPISKAELVDDAMLLLKVAVVVISGGSAAAIVAASAGQLKKGTLGQTETGRTILEIAEVAGYAYAADQAISDAVANKATDIAIARGQTYTIKQTGLEGSELGTIAVGASFVAGGTAVKGGDVSSSLSSYGQSTAITEAGRATPGGNILAEMYFKYGISKPDVGFDSTESERSSFWDNFEMPDIASLPGRIADAFSNINLGNISLPNIDISAPSLDFPGFSLPEINVGQIPDIPWPFPGGPKRKVISRRRIPGGYQYCDENNVCQDVIEQTASIWPWLLLAIAGTILIRRSY